MLLDLCSAKYNEMDVGQNYTGFVSQWQATLSKTNI